MTSFKVLCLSLPLVFSAGYVLAQDGKTLQTGDVRNTIYLGAGDTNSSDPFENDDMPFSVGFMHQTASRMIFGFDIGREGTMLDSTWGQNAKADQATSYNFLLGGNFLDTGRFSANAALLLGIRESTSDCPASFLGYQCYADTDPETDYEGNYGGVVTFSFKRAMLGVRITGESTQALVGFRF